MRANTLFSDLAKRIYLTQILPKVRAIKALKKGVFYQGENCNRGPKNDPRILELALLLVNR